MECDGQLSGIRYSEYEDPWTGEYVKNVGYDKDYCVKVIGKDIGNVNGFLQQIQSDGAIKELGFDNESIDSVSEIELSNSFTTKKYLIKNLSDNSTTEKDLIEKSSEYVSVENIILNDISDIRVNEKIACHVNVLPENATNKMLIWESSDNNIATVNSEGIITGIAVGKATISVKTLDGGYKTSKIVSVGKAEENNSMWIEDYYYDLDNDDCTIHLSEYIGNVSKIQVPKSVKLNGYTYYTVIGKKDSHTNPYGYDSRFKVSATVQSLSFEKGVQFPANAARLFANNENLESIDVSNWTMDHLCNLRETFSGCKSLKTIRGFFSTSNVTTMYKMFYGCSNIIYVDVSRFDTSKVTSTEKMFYGCSSLSRVDVSRFDTSKVEDMSAMFSGCTSLTTLDLSNFDTHSVWNMTDMFRDCAKLTSINLSGFDTSKVILMCTMFCGCSSLKNLDVSGFDTSKVEDMRAMFYGCKALTDLNLNNFNTSKVQSMYEMFQDCESLTNLNICRFDTSKVTDMNYMFMNCKSLATLDVSQFNTSNISELIFTFYGCKSLKYLDVSNFNISNVYHMESTFDGCESLTTLDVSGFDTSKVYYFSQTFNNCSSLTNLDVSKFDTAKAFDMTEMFAGCSSLKTLDVSGFNTSEVRYMDNMFNGCKALDSLDVSRFNTTNVVSLRGMFANCESLKVLDVSGFDTSSANGIDDMFYNDKSIISIRIPESFIHFYSDNMFMGINSVATIYFMGTREKWISGGYMIPETVKVICTDDKINNNDAGEGENNQIPENNTSNNEGGTGSTPDGNENNNNRNENQNAADEATNDHSNTLPGVIFGIKLDYANLTLGKGGKFTLNATVTLAGSAPTLKWSSSNKKVATVNSKGVITAKKKGSCTITVKTADGSASATCKLTVKKDPIKIKSASLNKKKLSLKKGKSYTLKADFKPFNATIKSTSYKTSDKKIATVSKKGVVKAKKKGSCTITVTIKDKSGKSKTAKCKVTVK